MDVAGNGRYVRNVMFEAVEKMKARVASGSTDADSDRCRQSHSSDEGHG
ncbi:hypothetical protein [Mycobacterium sp. URHB0021]